MNQWHDSSKAPKKSETYLCVFNTEDFELAWYNVDTGKWSHGYLDSLGYWSYSDKVPRKWMTIPSGWEGEK